MTEINQRSERDWAIYVDGEYRGTVTRVTGAYVCTHTRERFASRDAAVRFLEGLPWVQLVGLPRA